MANNTSSSARGFAAMSRSRQREIAAMGGRASHGARKKSSATKKSDSNSTSRSNQSSSDSDQE